jgi:hypothetical protein
MMCSGMGGKGNALKACDVGDEDGVDDCESIFVMFVFLTGCAGCGVAWQFVGNWLRGQTIGV